MSWVAGLLRLQGAQTAGVRSQGRGSWRYLPNATSFQAGGGPLERLFLTS